MTTTEITPEQVEDAEAVLAVAKGDAPTKTIGGKAGFTAADHAFVGHSMKPSTWKMPLTTTPGGAPDAGKVTAAIATLKNVPAAQLASVKAKLKAAWTKANPDKKPADMPAALKSAEPVDKGQHGLPAGAYAVVGDMNDPSTWKLPLWKDTSGAISPGRLSAALGHLSKMDDGSKVKVAHAYKHLYPTKPLPDALAAVMGEPSSKGALEPGFVPEMYVVVKALSPATVRGDLIDAVGELPNNPNTTIGAMIGFGLPSDVANAIKVDPSDGVLCQAPADMHVTLAYVPLPQGNQAAALELAAAAMRAACCARPFTAEITGVGVFTPGDDDDGDAPLAPGEDDGDADSDGPYFTLVALVDCPDLSELREDLIERLNDCDLPVDDSTHGFLPHITLACSTSADALKVIDYPEHLSWTVDSMCVAIGGVVQHYPLIGGWGQTDDETYGPVAMSADDAKRYTFAPLYVPGAYDSHKEWMDADDLQEAQWNFVRNGDRIVTLQHNPEIPAGEVVDIVTWPLPVRCELVTGDGVRKSVELPAGTVYAGVVWEEWAFKRAKAGLMGGLSLEGMALRTDEPLPS